MIDDVIQLAVEARVVRAYVEQSGKGIVLAKYKGDWVVWKVFRPKRGILWNCTNGRYTKDRSQAESWYVDAVDEMMPQVSCPECGYYFDDQEEGCDACVSRKTVPRSTVGVV